MKRKKIIKRPILREHVEQNEKYPLIYKAERMEDSWLNEKRPQDGRTLRKRGEKKTGKNEIRKERLSNAKTIT